MEHVVILCTCPRGEARDIVRALLDERLIACANLAGVTSLFAWQDDVEEAKETLLVMKTTREHWPALRDRILELHSYDVPEVLMLPVGDGSAGYLAWLDGVVA